jgi:hypothetical protein
MSLFWTFLKVDLCMSLAEEPLKFGQFVSPPGAQARMDALLAGNLSNWLADLKLAYCLYLEFSVVTPPHLFHLLPSRD